LSSSRFAHLLLAHGPATLPNAVVATFRPRSANIR
jgi:hypothetical protein